MIIGYTKLSGTPDPTAIDRVRQALIAAGAETVYVDTDTLWHATSADQPQHGLEVALSACSSGDTLLSLTPAQLARSVGELIAIADRLATKGAALRILAIAGKQVLDTSTQSGAMMLGALGLLAAFDRSGSGSIPVEQVDTISTSRIQAKAELFSPRRPRGRPPTATTQADEIARLRAAGMRATDIAERLKICRASVYRVLNLTTANPSIPNQPTVERAPLERTLDFVLGGVSS